MSLEKSLADLVAVVTTWDPAQPKPTRLRKIFRRGADGRVSHVDLIDESGMLASTQTIERDSMNRIAEVLDTTPTAAVKRLAPVVRVTRAERVAESARQWRQHGEDFAKFVAKHQRAR